MKFGPFGNVGMAAAYADSMSSIGLPPLNPQDCTKAFSQAGYAGQLVAAKIDLDRFATVNQTRSNWTFISELAMLTEVRRISLKMFHSMSNTDMSHLVGSVMVSQSSLLRCKSDQSSAPRVVFHNCRNG